MMFDHEELRLAVVRLANMQEQHPGLEITAVQLGIDVLGAGRVEARDDSILVLLARGKVGEAVIKGLCDAAPNHIEIIKREGS